MLSGLTRLYQTPLRVAFAGLSLTGTAHCEQHHAFGSSMALRPFLLLQSRDLDDPMREHEIDCFRRHLGVSEAELVTVNVVERLPTREELNRAAGLLMGGSGDYSCLDDVPWIHRFIEFARVAVLGEGRPTFAACFGFQILVRAMGGEMIRDPANMEIGTIPLDLTPAAQHDPIFSRLPRTFDAQVGHQDRATAYVPGVENLASSAACPLHAFRVGNLPVWATQFHPELDAADVRLRYFRYLAKYKPGSTEDSDHEAFLNGLRPSPHASGMLRHFAEWLRRRDAETTRPVIRPSNGHVAMSL